MRASTKTLQPVITFLTRSPTSTARIQSVLNTCFNVEPLSLNFGKVDSKTVAEDELNTVFSPFLTSKFHSEVSVDGSGTLLHFLSLSDNHVESSRVDEEESISPLSILAITDENEKFGATEAILHCRKLLANHIQQMGSGGLFANTKLQALKLASLKTLRRDITAEDILRLNGGLPLLQIPSPQTPQQPMTSSQKRGLRLREIVLPCADDSTYPNGISLFNTLSKSKLHRPKTGLYQWPCNPNGDLSSSEIFIRPLPVGSTDMILPSPTLIFQCDSISNISTEIGDNSQNAILSKVGRTSNTAGQLMLHHKHVAGVDLRFCESKELSSSFAESQESLMAGSLDDLQNVNVLVEGGNTSPSAYSVDSPGIRSISRKETETIGEFGPSSKLDSKNGLGDCWVEFRASVKRPTGFIKKGQSRVAKAPDIPYE